MGSKTRAKLQQRRAIYKGRILSLEVDHIVEPSGKEVEREIVRHKGSVAILPVLADGRVVLVRQYRYAVDDELLEIPAGHIDPGESPDQAASRELIEETGYTAGTLQKIGEFFPTPGFTDERMHLYLATGLLPGAPVPEDDESIECVTLPFDEMLNLARKGEVADAKTLVALLWRHALDGQQLGFDNISSV